MSDQDANYVLASKVKDKHLSGKYRMRQDKRVLEQLGHNKNNNEHCMHLMLYGRINNIQVSKYFLVFWSVRRVIMIYLSILVLTSTTHLNMTPIAYCLLQTYMVCTITYDIFYTSLSNFLLLFINNDNNHNYERYNYVFVQMH